MGVMFAFTLHPLTPADREWVERFVVDRWGAPTVAGHGVVYRVADLPGYYAAAGEARIGLVTYHVGAHGCEVVSLDSVRPNLGVGTMLIEAVVAEARSQGCARVWLITTNDNLHALGFYQRRGFVLVAVHRGAVERARQLKPQIPLIGSDGIPIRDEIELELPLRGGA